MKSWIRFDRYPSFWCPGCGIGIMNNHIAMAFHELGLDKKEVVIVSGIGCSGRTAGYFNCDTVHGPHGRAVAIAEGVKRGNPKLKVVVVSGDGDLLGIGGNHLMHTARRNVDITVICYNNEIYGMTGGQMAPTTPLEKYTVTSPFGNVYDPVNIQKLISSNNKYWFGRSSVWAVDHLKDVIKKAVDYEGFSFVEVIGYCITNYGVRVGFKDAHSMLIDIKKRYKVGEMDNIYSLGVVKS